MWLLAECVVWTSMQLLIKPYSHPMLNYNFCYPLYYWFGLFILCVTSVQIKCLTLSFHSLYSFLPLTYFF
jgi:hypothetical protein